MRWCARQKRRVQAMPLAVAGLAALAFAPASAGPPATSGNRPKESQGSGAVVRNELRQIRALQKAVRKNLSLDEDVAASINKLFEDYLGDVEAIVRELKEERRANAPRLEALRNEMNEATRAGDMERLRVIRSELAKLGTGRTRLRQAQTEFDAKVVAKLNEEQAKDYQRLSNRIRHQTSRFGRAKRGIGMVHRILRKMDISEEQQTKTRELMRDLRKSLAEAPAFAEPPGEVPRQELIIAQFRESVLDVLNDEQRGRYLELEKEETRGWHGRF